MRAEDASGKFIEKRLLLYVDNTPPVVLVSVPLGYRTDEYNGSVSAKGEAADDSPADLEDMPSAS